MTDQWTKWSEEIAEFMEPLPTSAGRKDFIEGVDGVVHEFPLQLYTHVAMAGRSKKTNYRFQFFLDGPYRKDMKGIEPIEKEFPDRVAQFWMLYFLHELRNAHADRAINRDEYLDAVNKFAEQDSMYFKQALQRRRQAQAKGHLKGRQALTSGLDPRSAHACFGTLPKEIITSGYHWVDRQAQILQEVDLLAVRQYLLQLHSDPSKAGAAGTSPLFRSVKLFWDGVGCDPHTWKASEFKRIGGTKNNADVPAELVKHFQNIVNAVRQYAGLSDLAYRLNDSDGMCQWPGCEGGGFHMDANYPGCAVVVHLTPGRGTQFVRYKGKVISLLSKSEREEESRTQWDRLVQLGGDDCDGKHIVATPQMYQGDVLYFDHCHIHRVGPSDQAAYTNSRGQKLSGAALTKRVKAEIKNDWMPRLTLFLGFSRNAAASTEYKCIKDADGWARLDAADAGVKAMIGPASMFDQQVKDLPRKRKRNKSASPTNQAASTLSSFKAAAPPPSHATTNI
jgi:hypothetical protein